VNPTTDQSNSDDPPLWHDVPVDAVYLEAGLERLGEQISNYMAMRSRYLQALTQGGARNVPISEGYDPRKLGMRTADHASVQFRGDRMVTLVPQVFRIGVFQVRGCQLDHTLVKADERIQRWGAYAQYFGVSFAGLSEVRCPHKTWRASYMQSLLRMGYKSAFSLQGQGCAAGHQVAAMWRSDILHDEPVFDCGGRFMAIVLHMAHGNRRHIVMYSPSGGTQAYPPQDVRSGWESLWQACRIHLTMAKDNKEHLSVYMDCNCIASEEYDSTTQNARVHLDSLLMQLLAHGLVDPFRQWHPDLVCPSHTRGNRLTYFLTDESLHGETPVGGGYHMASKAVIPTDHEAFICDICLPTIPTGEVQQLIDASVELEGSTTTEKFMMLAETAALSDTAQQDFVDDVWAVSPLSMRDVKTDVQTLMDLCSKRPDSTALRVLSDLTTRLCNATLEIARLLVQT
jgi:hypothetical protein